MGETSSDSETENVTETETLFNEAANVVQTNANGGSSGSKPTDSQLLELYGLYKVATCGPCNESQPGILNMKARSKWSAWKHKSELSVEDARVQYINQVKNIFNWIPSKVGEMGDHSSSKESLGGGFAPVVSRPHIPEDTLSSNTPFDWIKDNEINKLKEWITKENVDLNYCDDEGLSLLHWAADRGRKEICEILLHAGADPSRKDEDEQTPLDYAITCEHDDIITLLKTFQNLTVTPT